MKNLLILSFILFCSFSYGQDKIAIERLSARCDSLEQVILSQDSVIGILVKNQLEISKIQARLVQNQSQMAKTDDNILESILILMNKP